MKQFYYRAIRSACSRKLIFVAIGMVLLHAGCTRTAKKPAETPSEPSKISVVVTPGGPVALTTSSAEFQILPSGYIQALLLKAGQQLSLDDPGQGNPEESDYLVRDGKEVHFTMDFGQTKITEAVGKLGRGKQVEIPAQPIGPSGTSLLRTLRVEVYDDFPNILLSSVAYTNTGQSEYHIDHIVEQQHRFNSHMGKENPYDIWSYQGSSYEWGKDDVVKLTGGFSQPNLMGGMVKGGYGGGIPVVAFWTASVGEGIVHVETLPLSLSLPVKVERDRRVSTAVRIPADTTLKPGESYSTPRSFVAVYHGDFYEPLRLWSSVLQKEGWEIPKPSSEAYNVSWCGWGYEFNVTPAQMLGTVPKLKEFGIKWATLDDRWFDTYGDWNPRPDTFPGDSIKKMTDDFHKQGESVQLWWLPLAAEDDRGKWESHKYIVSKVAQEHPDWFILNKDSKHARITRDLAALCPAVPEVQAYYKQLTEKFIRDWGFDGSKLDNIFSVPACYNPAH